MNKGYLNAWMSVLLARKVDLLYETTIIFRYIYCLTCDILPTQSINPQPILVIHQEGRASLLKYYLY